MAQSQSPDDLDADAIERREDAIQRWKTWSTRVMRQYYGREFLWGEEAALKWLNEQKFEGGDAD